MANKTGNCNILCKNKNNYMRILWINVWKQWKTWKKLIVSIFRKPINLDRILSNKKIWTKQ